MVRMLRVLPRRSSAGPLAAFRPRLERVPAALTLMLAALVGAPAGAFEPGSLGVETGSGASRRFEVELATTPEDIEQFRDAMTPDPRLLRDLAGRWHMEAKEKDAIVPNIMLVLQPDGSLDFFRDDSGGTNFSLHLWGAWAPSSPAAGRVEISFHFIGAQPKRSCLALAGGCEDYGVPFWERWAFTETGPGTMETSGAIWHHDPPP
jgi:hypothetical protein